MWEYEYALETSADRDALWRCWSDMRSWPAWNDGLESIKVDGPFAVGTAFHMTAPGDDTVSMRLTEVVEGVSFTDEMDGGDFLVTTCHRLEPLPGGGTRVTYRTEIHGLAGDIVGPGLGPAITADFSDVVAALVKHAG